MGFGLFDDSPPPQPKLDLYDEMSRRRVEKELKALQSDPPPGPALGIRDI